MKNHGFAILASCLVHALVALAVVTLGTRRPKSVCRIDLTLLTELPPVAAEVVTPLRPEPATTASPAPPALVPPPALPVPATTPTPAVVNQPPAPPRHTIAPEQATPATATPPAPSLPLVGSPVAAELPSPAAVPVTASPSPLPVLSSPSSPDLRPLAETTEETAAASRAVHPRGTSADEFLPAGSIPPEAATAIMTRLRGFVQYPERARLSGWEGKAILSFRLGADGQARDIEVVTSSGFPLLDRSAVSAVRRASPFPYRPHQEIALRLPVVYALH